MWPEGAMWSDDDVGKIFAERDAARQELDDKTVALGEAEAWITRYAHERDAATARAERAEAAIQRVRALAEEWKRSLYTLNGAPGLIDELFAALDSSGTVEDAPRTCPCGGGDIIDAAIQYVETPAEDPDHQEGRLYGFLNDAVEHWMAVTRRAAMEPTEAERLASGEICQPGQPAACGDFHNAGQCLSRAEPSAQLPEERSDEKRRPVIECELGVAGDWCALPIGHAGACNPTRRISDSSLPVDGETT